MKCIRPLFMILLMLPVTFSCSQKKNLATIDVQKPSSVKSEGYYYFLPRTVISVDVAITKTTHQPGPFSRYAESLLGLQQVITATSVDYSIAEITINHFAEPDPEHLYFIEAGIQNSPFFMSFSEAGLIQSINNEFDSETYSKNDGETKAMGNFGTEATFNYFIDINLQERIDTIMERVRMDTITIERQTLRRSWVEKSSDVRAKEVADYILKIRDKKFDLITGYSEIPYSKEALEYMYTEMDKKENDYLDLFTGISSSGTIMYRFTYMPQAEQVGSPSTLFHFSKKDGVVPGGIPGSLPVTIQAKRSQESSYLEPLAERTAASSPGRKGFFYRIPDHATVVISEGQNIRAEARMLINQYGVVTSLPPANLEIEFYPNTGSVKSIRHSGE